VCGQLETLLELARLRPCFPVLNDEKWNTPLRM